MSGYTEEERLLFARQALADLESKRESAIQRLAQMKASSSARTETDFNPLERNLESMTLLMNIQELERRIDYQKDLIYDLEQEITRSVLEGDD